MRFLVRAPTAARAQAHPCHALRRYLSCRRQPAVALCTHTHSMLPIVPTHLPVPYRTQLVQSVYISPGPASVFCPRSLLFSSLSYFPVSIQPFRHLTEFNTAPDCLTAPFFILSTYNERIPWLLLYLLPPPPSPSPPPTTPPHVLTCLVFALAFRVVTLRLLAAKSNLFMLDSQ